MDKPEVGSIVHYVMPDLSCRAAVVTKAMGLAVNLFVFSAGPEEAQEPFVRPYAPNSLPFVQHQGTSPHKKPAEYVPAIKWLEDRHNKAEQKRYEEDMAKTQTDEEKQAVRPMADFQPPSPEVLAGVEEQQELAYAEMIKNSYFGTYHATDCHEEIVNQQRDLELRKANRELAHVKAKHAAHIQSITGEKA